MKRLMFVCKRNSCRSQMAEGFARNLGTESFEVVSAGLESSNVNPTAVDVMREAGVDIYAQLPNLFLDSNQPTSMSLFLSVVAGSISRKLGHRRQIFEDWFIDDPDGKPIEEFRAARDAIKQHVLKLLDSQKMLTKPSVSI